MILNDEIDAAIQERFPGRGNAGIRTAIRMALGRGERAESLADHPELTAIRPRLGEDLRAIDIVVYQAKEEGKP